MTALNLFHLFGFSEHHSSRKRFPGKLETYAKTVFPAISMLTSTLRYTQFVFNFEKPGVIKRNVFNMNRVFSCSFVGPCCLGPFGVSSQSHAPARRHMLSQIPSPAREMPCALGLERAAREVLGILLLIGFCAPCLVCCTFFFVYGKPPRKGLKHSSF